MTEVPHAGRHHHHATLVGGGNDFTIAHATARLDNATGAHIDHHIEAIAEGKEGVAGHR